MGAMALLLKGYLGPFIEGGRPPCRRTKKGHSLYINSRANTIQAVILDAQPTALPQAY